MSETEGFWWCPVHGIVVSWPCPLCSRMAISASTDARPITEAELQARLDVHARSIEQRLHDQRSEVARLISEATRELRDEIGVMKARIADQDAEIAQLRNDLKTQEAIERTTHQYVTATEKEVDRLRRRFAGNIADLSFASSRQDKKIEGLETAIATIGPIVTHLVEQPVASSIDCRSETGITVGLSEAVQE